MGFECLLLVARGGARDKVRISEVLRSDVDRRLISKCSQVGRFGGSLGVSSATEECRHLALNF